MGRYENFIISLDIRGYDINVQEISKAMSLNCTYFFNENNRKMQRKKTIEDIWSHNLWSYERESNYEGFELMCDDFLASIQNVKCLSDLQNQISDIRLHLMINSQLAQIHAFLPRKFFSEVSSLGLPMDINIISFGCVESESD
ncbi:MAG: hypothetical protein PHR14_00110 [Oscillospiraceae bacterium]|nr:hypothetical protein [Oscillospiraceae bacterium]